MAKQIASEQFVGILHDPETGLEERKYALGKLVVAHVICRSDRMLNYELIDEIGRSITQAGADSELQERITRLLKTPSRLGGVLSESLQLEHFPGAQHARHSWTLDEEEFIEHLLQTGRNNQAELIDFFI